MRSLIGGSGRVAVAILLLGALAGCGASGAGGHVLSEDLSEPLNGATAAKVDIHCGPGHLTVDRLAGGEQLLARGTLQYLENQPLPTRTVDASGGQASLTLKGSGSASSGFRWPWLACAGGAFEWQVHLNPKVQYDITAHSDGGNVRLDLGGMAVSRLTADTGGGNIDVALPENAANLGVTARTGGGNVTVEVASGTTGNNTIDASSGAGNVAVRVPGDIAVRVHATSGAGKVSVDPRFNRTDASTYQSPDYDGAANKVEITLHSGAGNVTVNSR